MWLTSLLLSSCYPIFRSEQGSPTGFPLGGVAPGRGRPLPERSFETGFSIGPFPELGGTVEQDSPIPTDRSTSGDFAALGMGGRAGVASWADIGLSGSRGLYSTMRLIETERWALSVSPAYFRFTNQATRDEDGTVVNYNLTGLIAFRPGDVEGFRLELYGGSGINRYSVTLPDPHRDHQALTPTVIGGLMVEIDRRRSREWNITPTWSFGYETTGTWLTQRNGRRDLVRISRIQIALRTSPAW